MVKHEAQHEGETLATGEGGAEATSKPSSPTSDSEVDRAGSRALTDALAATLPMLARCPVVSVLTPAVRGPRQPRAHSAAARRYSSSNISHQGLGDNIRWAVTVLQMTGGDGTAPRESGRIPGGLIFVRIKQQEDGGAGKERFLTVTAGMASLLTEVLNEDWEKKGRFDEPVVTLSQIWYREMVARLRLRDGRLHLS